MKKINNIGNTMAILRSTEWCTELSSPFATFFPCLLIDIAKISHTKKEPIAYHTNSVAIVFVGCSPTRPRRLRTSLVMHRKRRPHCTLSIRNRYVHRTNRIE